MKIYFRSRKKPENMTGIKELLQNGYSGKYDGNFKPTYSDPKCQNQECHPARRSFDDLLTICKTYFPKTTQKELAKTLFELNEEIGLGGSYCITINKPVFFKRGIKNINSFMFNNRETVKGKSKFSFSQIKSLSKQK